MNDKWTWTEEDEKKLDAISRWSANYGPRKARLWLITKLQEALREINQRERRNKK